MVSSARRVLAGIVLVALVSSACGGAEDLRGPVPTRPTESPLATTEVRRSTIVETVRGIARVTSANEAALYFRAGGRVRSVNVETGQPVRQGEIIAELEAGQSGVQLEIARVNLTIAELRTSQAAEVTGESSVRQVAGTLARADAEHARALADLETRRATAGWDVKILEATLASTRARLAAATAGASAADLAAAEHTLASARAALTRAETELARAREGYTPEAIAGAEHALNSARNALYAAQVERDAARGRGDGVGTAAGDARIAAAQANIDAAAERLALMRAGGKPEDIGVAERNLESARAQVQSAEARLKALKAGPRSEEIAVAASAVEEAQARLAAAQAAEAGSGASLQSAEAAVEAAAAALENARAALPQREAGEEAAGGRAVDALLAEKQLEIAKLNVTALEQQIEDGRLRAPFDGTISRLNVRPGDQIQAFASIGILADPSKLELTADVLSTDLEKLKPGQPATVTLEQRADQALTEKVLGIPTDLTSGRPVAGSGETRPVRISLRPDVPGLVLGMAAEVSIVTRQKDDALVVPATAVKRFGGRRLVQVVGPDGRRRDVEVEVGVSTESEVEILDGLAEGQTIVAS